ncbi:MAG: IS3 family transposase [Gemmatimonadaceae bacterium]
MHGIRTCSARSGDNAHAESFFHSLKAEVTRGVRYDLQAALRAELVRYVPYYNRSACTQVSTTNHLLPSNGRRRQTTRVNESGARSQRSVCPTRLLEPWRRWQRRTNNPLTADASAGYADIITRTLALPTACMQQQRSRQT